MHATLSHISLKLKFTNLHTTTIRYIEKILTKISLSTIRLITVSLTSGAHYQMEIF